MIFLGTINNAGSDVVNNQTTSSPFEIPRDIRMLILQPSAATQLAATKGRDAAFLPAATDMIALGAASAIVQLPLALTDATARTVAIRKTDAGAATTKVFGAA